MNLPVLLAQGIKRKVYDALSLDRMNEKYGILALNHVFMMACVTLEVVFVNILIMRVSGGDIQAVLTNRALVFIFTAVGMNMVPVLSRKINAVTAIRVSGFLYILVFFVLLIGTEQIFLLVYAVGALSGLAWGFYWFGQIALLTSYTTQQNRAVGIAIFAVIQGSMALVMPLASGGVIDFMPGMDGYRLMFGAAIVALVVQRFFIMCKLPPVQTEHRKSEYRIAFRLLFKRAGLRIMAAMEFSRGLRDGVFGFFLNLVLFEIVNSESLVGVNSFLAGLASILAAWLYGRMITDRNKGRLTVISVSVLMAFFPILYFAIGPATVILFSVANAFFAMFINNSVMNNSFDALGQNEQTRSVMSELIGIREAALVSGRISGIVIMALFPAGLQGYVQAMLALTATQYVVAFLLYLSRRVREREQSRELEVSDG